MQGNVPRRHFRFLKRKSRFIHRYPEAALDAAKAKARARSVARSSFATPSRRIYDDEVHIPMHPYSYKYGYDTTGNDNYTRTQVNRNLLLSSAAMEDNFDISNRSRQRDRDVMTAANKAISPSVTTTPGLDNLSPGVSGIRRSQSLQSLRRSNPRSSSMPPKRPTTVTTSIIPLDLAASPASQPSPYLKYSNSLHTTNSLRNSTYKPFYSQSLRTESPSRAYSPFRDDSPYREVSPYRSESPFYTPSSGEQTPVEHWYPADSRLPSSRRRRKPRVLSTKRKTGNYYNRLLNRRAQDSGGQQGKYWPYLDVEDIENTSIGDLLSDTESLGDSNSYLVASGNSGRGDSNTYLVASGNSGRGDSNTYLYGGGNSGSYYGDYEDTTDNSGALVTYVADTDPDIPSEYVPFRPRARYRSPERDYSDFSIIPHLPKRDPTQNSSADDIAFNALVAASAARARQALEKVNLDEYDSASMVFSVEGEYHSPDVETPVGFKYVSRPLALKVPASRIVSVYDSDNAFTKYVTDLQKFREGIRKRLEEGYRALSEETKSYRPSLTSSSYQPYTSRPSRALTSYRKRLGDSSEYKYGQSLELYPVTASRGETQRSRSLQRTSTEALPESRALTLYDSHTEPSSRLSTLDKVQIKAATELYTSPRTAVAARRAMRGQSTPPGPIQTSANYSRAEAALIGSRVDVTTPNRRRPRSLYAQNKLRQIHLGSSSRDASPTGVAVVTDTAGLKAHKPVFVKTHATKPIQDVDGPKKPNIMSWQPNDEIKPSERAKRRRLKLLKKHRMEY